MIPAITEPEHILKSTKTPSLRIRYFSLTLVLGVLIIGFVYNTFTSLSHKNNNATRELTKINLQIHTIDQINNNITNIYRTINLFLLNPRRKEQIQIINRELINSVQLINKSEFNSQHEQAETSIPVKDQLQANFKTLQIHLKELIKIRSDTNLQYPGMAISANIMAIQQNNIRSILNQLQQEIEDGDFKPKSNNTYSQILKARINVEKAISQSRIYMANRLALFSDEILTSQAISLTNLHNAVLKNLRIIKESYRNESDSFVGFENVTKTIQTQKDWYINFERLRVTSESDHWQEDSRLMESQISPLLEKSSSLLSEQYIRLQTKKQNITDSFKNNSQNLFYILAIIIVIFLAFIIVILLSLDLMVFKPIKNIAEVMKAKALGHSDVSFSFLQSRETNNIITAFNNLDKKVKERSRELNKSIIKEVKAKEEAKAANASKSLFLSNMSHELRTPLHGILSFSELALSKSESIDNKKSQQYFEVIHQSGERLSLLLNDLLDLSRLEAGRETLHINENNLLQTATIITRQLDSELLKKHLTVNIHSDEPSLSAAYDNEKIAQVIQNLTSNAIKFSPDNSQINIFINTISIDEQDFAQFKIEDNGIGIPEDELEDIFGKFIESSKTQSNAGGTGLGLAICKEIIRLHDGTIWAQKTDHKGACFVFNIPVKNNLASDTN